MRWFSMVMFCLVLSLTIADPDPKKYKKESSEKEKKAESLTDDERNFLRDVEEKYAIKADSPTSKNNKEENGVKENKTSKDNPQEKTSLPAVIAIEIVNDTETISKGKRTIDANLGYGYKTNNGYHYTYFGRSNLDKGKFMIYPYSQSDIPPSRNLNYNSKYSSQFSGKKSSQQSPNFEIQPSQAYELVTVKDEQPSYEYKKPAIPFNTNYQNGYNSGTSSAGSQSAGREQTLYTTYNGQEFSGLSGQFPSVMSNYFVNPTQLLQNPQYQNAGLTQDHLRSQSSYINQNQQIVPVLVLRIPSSHLNNPSAELYPDLPNNYPLSQPLNHVNLQSLVNQYFKKNGYQFAPKLMSYQNPTVPTPESEPQHYSNPYVRPSYTEADYSGIKYSAVKPVMARYPNSHKDQKYTVTRPQSLYQRPVQQQYEYRYMPQTEVKMQSYYIQPQYSHNAQISEDAGYQSEQPEVHNEQTYPSVAYQSHQEVSNHNPNEAEAEYEMKNTQLGQPEPNVEQYIPESPVASDYSINQDSEEYQTKTVASEQGSDSPSPYSSSNYYSLQQAPKTAVSVFPSRLIHSEQYEEKEEPSVPQNYTYQTQSDRDSSKSLVLSENYPSKDHTIATVLPYAYKAAKQPPQSSIQSVSYVTPVPSAKYQSQYRIMVPQTVLKNPNAERVSYVNSHSLPMHYTQVGHYTEPRSESDYSAEGQYVSSIQSSKPLYTRNFHSHPKRMAKPDHDAEASSANHTAKKQNERNDKKKSS